MINVNKQIKKLYTSSVIANLSLTGAWVTLLAARGFSLVEIGIAETVFHLVSLIFELPSGVLADVFGKKKMLIVSALMCMIGNIAMILSGDLFMVCLSIAFQALNYNFSSGSGDALAYETMKLNGTESGFERYESNQLIIYRICGGLSTLCAGFALTIGHKAAYGADLLMCALQIAVLMTLKEVPTDSMAERRDRGTLRAMVSCFRESAVFLRKAGRAVGLMMCNSFVGAIDILLLFYLQAKLRERGIPLWLLGPALLFMELGGVVGSKLILKLPHLRYRHVFAVCTMLVLLGLAAEHSAYYWVMAAGGFIAAMGDDALQVRTNARLQDMFPSEQRATLTSADSFSFSVIMIVLSPLAGYFFSIW